MRYHFPSLLAALLSPLLLQTLVAAPEKSAYALQAEFMKLKFGMFIHYNMETYHGVQWVPSVKRKLSASYSSFPSGARTG